MELFNVINEFLKEMETTITVWKNDDNEYGACFSNRSKENLEFREIGEDMIDTIVKAARKTGISSDVTVTKREQTVLNNIVEIIDEYTPFLHLILFRDTEDGEFKGYISHGYGYLGNRGVAIGNVNVSDDVEEVIRKIAFDTRLLLILTDEKNLFSRIAEYITHENMSHSTDDTEFIMRKKNNKYSVQIRANRTQIEAVDNDLKDAVWNALSKTNAASRWITKHAFIESGNAESYALRKIAKVLDLSEPGTAFKISEKIDKTIDPKTLFALERMYGTYKLQFVNTSTRKVFAENTCCTSCVVYPGYYLTRAVFDAAKEMDSIMDSTLFKKTNL